MTYPDCDARVAFELVHQHIQLARELSLLLSIGKNPLQWTERGHILDNKKTYLITCSIKQIGFDFDLSFSR